MTAGLSLKLNTSSILDFHISYYPPGTHTEDALAHDGLITPYQRDAL